MFSLNPKRKQGWSEKNEIDGDMNYLLELDGATIFFLSNGDEKGVRFDLASKNLL